MSSAASLLAKPPCPPLDPGTTALFLDLDGTLAAIAPRPEGVRPDPALNTLLRRLHKRLHGRLAVVSGRTLADVDALLEGAVPALAGVHGLERRAADGGVTAAAPARGVASTVRRLQAFAERRPGLLVEDKGLSVTLHYRQAPEHEPAARALVEARARTCGLKLEQGHKVFELKTPGADKGSAVRAFMAEPPFAGAVPIFVGDDRTDEDGFAAAAALGGWGVRVGGEGPTAARESLADPAAVRAWLEAALR